LEKGRQGDGKPRSYVLCEVVQRGWVTGVFTGCHGIQGVVVGRFWIHEEGLWGHRPPFNMRKNFLRGKLGEAPSSTGHSWPALYEHRA
jgi:hypothetical protein